MAELGHGMYRKRVFRLSVKDIEYMNPEDIVYFNTLTSAVVLRKVSAHILPTKNHYLPPSYANRLYRQLLDCFDRQLLHVIHRSNRQLHRRFSLDNSPESGARTHI